MNPYLSNFSNPLYCLNIPGALNSGSTIKTDQNLHHHNMTGYAAPRTSPRTHRTYDDWMLDPKAVSARSAALADENSQLVDNVPENIFVEVNDPSVTKLAYSFPFEDVKTWVPTSKTMGLKDALKNAYQDVRHLFTDRNVKIYVDSLLILPAYWKYQAKPNMKITIELRYNSHYFYQKSRTDIEEAVQLETQSHKGKINKTSLLVQYDHYFYQNYYQGYYNPYAFGNIENHYNYNYTYSPTNMYGQINKPVKKVRFKDL